MNYKLVIMLVVAVATIGLLQTQMVFAQPTNSVFSNINNFTVSGSNNRFIINTEHGTPNATNTNSSIFSKTADVISFDPAHNQVTLANHTKVAVSQLPADEQKQVLSSNNNKTGTDESALTNSSSVRLPSASPMRQLASIQPAKRSMVSDTNQSKGNVTFPLAPSNPFEGLQRVAAYDKAKNCATNLSLRPTPMEYLTYFNCGNVSVLANGTTVRHFSLVIEENHIIPITLEPNVVPFPGWTFNGTIPGPTMRMTEGDHVSVTVYNRGKLVHTLHMHSIHPGMVDGVPGLSGDAGAIQPGGQHTYSFVAGPYGVYPYHCHADPLIVHINRGLYGVMIIDPKTPRPAATEMVMLLNGYSLRLASVSAGSMLPHLPSAMDAATLLSGGETNDTAAEPSNDIYTANGVAFYYYQYPIHLKTHTNYRLYLVNMLDFDTANTFHIHGTLFDYIPSGTAMTPSFKNDMVLLTQADRGILQFSYDYPGNYMIHSHLSDQSDKGWTGYFEVKDR